MMLGLAVLPATTIASSAVIASSATTAGYQLTAASGDNLTAIRASWVVPTATCSGTTSTFANMSAMIDGFMSPKTDQLTLGTYSNCVSGVATYGAYYALFLGTSKPKVISPLPAVKAGDVIQVSESWNAASGTKHGGGTNQGWKGTLTDVTTGLSGKVSDKSSTKAALNSASFILSIKSGVTVSHFGTAMFGYAATKIRSTCTLTAGFSNRTVLSSISIASLANHSGFSLTQYRMVASGGVTVTPSALDSTGKSFTLTRSPV